MKKTCIMTAMRPMRYGTRRLQAGDTFKANDVHALLMFKRGQAAYAKPVVKFAQASAVVPDGSIPPAPVDEMTALRAQYTAALGKRPFPGWSADVLREKMAAAETES